MHILLAICQQTCVHNIDKENFTYVCLGTHRNYHCVYKVTSITKSLCFYFYPTVHISINIRLFTHTLL